MHLFRSKLVTQYAAVWARAADEVLPALAALEPLRQTPHLKYKIVFSVVVVSLNIIFVYHTELGHPMACRDVK